MSDYRKSKTFVFLAWLSILIVAGLTFLALFRPTIGFSVVESAGLPPGSELFLRKVRIMAHVPLHTDCDIDVLTDGELFYEAELQAINSAKDSVYIEVYIWDPGEIADRFRQALTDRARVGVDVRLIMDAVGSMNIPADYFEDLEAAGGKVTFYHSVEWHTWDKVNNRTHRVIFLIDHTVAFLGGAGIGDAWWKPEEGRPPWRDTMFRLTGEAVDSVKSVFLENWVEATGEIITADLEHSVDEADPQDRPCFVVGSTPSFGGSTRARILYQYFVDSARESIIINNPYFLPDEDLRGALVRAAQRGVKIQVILPGDTIDWEMTRSASRSNLEDLLRAGTVILEYQPTMNHRKIFVVDGLWILVGSTNLDSRSFALNDEVNLIARDEQVAAKLTSDFAMDLAHSKEITYEEWKNRPWSARVKEMLSGLLERQQ